MLYALLLYVCASAEPCKIEDAETVIASSNLTVEECIDRGPRAAQLIAGDGKYYRIRCKLEPQRKA